MFAMWAGFWTPAPSQSQHSDLLSICMVAGSITSKRTHSYAEPVRVPVRQPQVSLIVQTSERDGTSQVRRMAQLGERHVGSSLIDTVLAPLSPLSYFLLPCLRRSSVDLPEFWSQD